MAFCFHCGAELKDGAKFCTKCGKKVVGTEEKPAETFDEFEQDDKVSIPMVDTEDSLAAENVVESEAVTEAEITDTNSSQKTTNSTKRGTWNEPVQQPTQKTTGYYYGNPVSQPAPKKKNEFNITIFIIVISTLGALSSVSNFNIVSLLIALIQLALGIVLLLEDKKLVKLPSNFLNISDDKRKQLFTTVALLLIILFVISTSIGNSISSKKHTNDYSPSISKNNAETNDTVDYTSEDELTVKYNVMDNGKVEIIGYEGKGKTATISSKYLGKKVIRIANNAFKDCKALEEIIIWADIEEYGASSFENCKKLKEISISSNAKTIGANAFKNCTALEDVTIWGNPDIGEYAFSGCNKIKDVSISSGTKNVGAYAFENCTGITDLTIWGVDTICDYAFYGCSGIKEVSIPSDVKSIGNHAFDGCTSLTEVTIWSDNTAIGKDAFINCPKLKDVPAERGTVPKYSGTAQSAETTTKKTETTTRKETTTKKETTTRPKSKYEKAYIRDLSNYDLYYMFDTDKKEVISFGTNDSGVMKGKYTGKFSDKVTIDWGDGWKETFEVDGDYATLTDNDGFDWEYEKCSVASAEKVLKSIE